MTWLRIFIHRMRGLFLKRKLERELEDEIRSHLEMQIEDYAMRCEFCGAIRGSPLWLC